MRIVQITPGAGKMYCGGCIRDHALVIALRKLGHSVVMAPLYLPATLEQEDAEPETPVFFGGINVYLEQKSSLFRRSPRWLRRALASNWLLKRVAGAATSTKPADLGALTVSMLKGEEGRQAQELEDLLSWLKVEKPQLVSLSNALLVGLARRIKSELGVPVICSFQGEDEFLDSLGAPYSSRAWETLAARAADVDLFISPSRYYAELMARRLHLDADRIRVIHNGIDLDGFLPSDGMPAGENRGSTIGFFGRMCRQKGLDVLVEAFILLRKHGNDFKLRVGGYCGVQDAPFVEQLRERLKAEGCLEQVEFCPNLSRAQKLEFFRSLAVFSTPATYSEAFGLYVIEALAAGVPVVQPAHSAFPELIQATGGGVLCKRNDPDSLAMELERLLKDPKRARALGAAGRRVVCERFSMEKMAAQIAHICEEQIEACVPTI